MIEFLEKKKCTFYDKASIKLNLKFLITTSTYIKLYRKEKEKGMGGGLGVEK